VLSFILFNGIAITSFYKPSLPFSFVLVQINKIYKRENNAPRFEITR